MPALLAGVASEGVWQGDYLPPRFYGTTTRRVAARRAENPVLVVAGPHLTRFAGGADQGARSGS
jgi:hypothetical protein